MGSRPELKVDDETGFISFFNRLPKTEAVRIFERNDFYTVHGSDALHVAETVYKTTSVIRQLGSSRNSLPSCTLSITVFRTFLRSALLVQGKRIEIWVQKGRGNWEIGKQASPGNLQDVEEDFAGQIESAPVIAAVKIQAKGDGRVVGVCFADASVRELGISEFADNEVYSNLESLIIQLGAKECILQVDPNNKDLELKKVREVVDRCQVVVTLSKASDFSIKDIEQDLSRLLADECTTGMLPYTENKIAMGASSALIRYLSLMADELNFGQYHLYQHDLSQYMKLDASAVRALNLMPGPRDGSKNMSLYGLLNKCKTVIGTRLLSQWLKQPLMSLEEIEKRHILVESFVEDTELRQTMQEQHLRKIPDLYRLSKRFQRGLATLEDVVRAYQVVITIPDFIATLEGVMDEKYSDVLEQKYTNKLRGISSNLDKLQELVETTVDLDAIDNHEFIIKPEFNEDLQNIKARIDDLKADMNQEHKHASKDIGLEIHKKLFLEDHKAHGWCFRLTKTEAGSIRNKGYKEITTQKNGVYFTTNKLQSLNREVDQANQNYDRTQRGLVDEVVGVVTTYCPILEELAEVLSHLDVIVSFAHVSVHAPTAYVRPKMHPRGQGDTVLIEARHPCMEMQDDIQFITNDVKLKHRESEFLIITGPNMGGKSTYIRQIGVIALMAQVGCFVPCSEAELTIFDCILARVGASDSQLKGVSTFMAEMLETSTILKSASSESLIIIDELGRGTSTYDGFGLAWAISEHIIKEIRCFAMFATHFHELTALSNEHPGVKNLHVVAHIGNRQDEGQEITLLYKVDEGVCDQSFGIHVAELVKFPPKVVKMAKRKADELEDFTMKHGGEQHIQCTKEQIATGSALLKRLLMEWKEEISNVGMSPVEMRAKLRKLAQNQKYKEAFENDPFFRNVKTLS